MQPGDVTTGYVTMDMYLVVQCAQSIADTHNRLSVVSYDLLSSLPRQQHCSSCACVGDRGSALARRLNEREKEMEADERDRQKEKEELEEIRRRLLDDGHPDPDAEMAKVPFCFFWGFFFFKLKIKLICGLLLWFFLRFFPFKAMN